MVELPLLEAEQGADRYRIKISEYPQMAVEQMPLSSGQRLLLLTEQSIDEPILQLMLEQRGRERSITLFIDPTAPHSRVEYLRNLIEVNQDLQAQSGRLLQQLNQLQQRSVEGATWISEVQQQIFSSWIGFLLLGGVIALPFWLWWRAAEPMELEQKSETLLLDEEQEWVRFHQEVAQIEAEIESAVKQEHRE